MSVRRHLLISALAAGATLATAPYALAQAGAPIKVGTDATFPPMEFVENGKRTGFDIELVEALGKAMGRPIEWIDIDFKGLIPGLIKSSW